MSETFPLALAQVVRRYQRCVMLRAALTLALGMACAALMVRRMPQTARSPQMVMLAVGTLWGALAAWQGWRLRRGWLSARATLATLDRQLGLQARLMTAAEFANAPEPPALYATLVQETEHSLEAAAHRSPSVMSRTAFMFAGLLLLIWLWPWPAPTGVGTTQLARMASPPPLPPPEPPSPPPELPPPPQSPQPQQQPQQSQPQKQQSPSQSQQSQQGQQEQKGRQGTESAQGNQGTQGTKGTQGTQGTKGTQGEQGAQDKQGQQEQKGAQGTQGQQQGTQEQRGSQRGQAAGQVGAGTEALRADIQQALKELSGELKTLQAQLEAQHVAAPAPGTSTDPELYGAASLEPPPGATSRLPLPLEMDTHATAAVRQGGGLGAPSRDIGTQTPRQAREATQLAAEAAPESATHQHAIPPEYQPVFEQLEGSSQ